MTTTQYPNGQVLSSTALTPSAISAILQILTCGAIGINPPDFSQVRVDWQTTGQPATPLPSQDVCYLSCVPHDTEYTRVRDRAYTTVAGVLTETWHYSKGWRISWTLYGPASSDHARALRSASFMDWFNDQLSLSQLWPLSDPPEVTRVPENYNSQWWERSDFYIDVYEYVTETIAPGAVTSVEIKVLEPADGQVADITVVKE
jgi:hypothetical protein